MVGCINVNILILRVAYKNVLVKEMRSKNVQG